MSVIHICNDYFGGNFYKTLFDKLAEKKINQFVIVVLRSDQLNYIENNGINIDNNRKYKIKAVKLNKSMSLLSRFFPGITNKFIFNKIKNDLIDFETKHNKSIIFSHTTYSNGTLGLYISKLLYLDYIISIRNVDVNTVYKKLIWQRNRLKKNLIGAKFIVSPSPSLAKELLDALKIKKCINKIPNPVSDFWNKNRISSIENKKNKDVNKLIYIGEINPNKNISFIIELIDKLGPNYHLTIIGGVKHHRFNKYLIKLKKLASKNDQIEILGEINDKHQLKKYLRNSDLFVMLSKYESFGLVYIEAMTQGLPILYTKGQGVDGYFAEGSIGYSVEYGNINEAINAIEKIQLNYNNISANCIRESKKFESEHITNKYLSLLHDEF